MTEAQLTYLIELQESTARIRAKTCKLTIFTAIVNIITVLVLAMAPWGRA